MSLTFIQLPGLPADSARTASSQEEYRLSDEIVVPGIKHKQEYSESAGTKETYLPLFTGHQLRPVSSGEKPFQPRNPDWFSVVIFLVILIFTWFRVFYYKILTQLFNAFFSKSVTSQIVRDENMLVQRASVMLTAVFNLIAALFLYQVTVIYDIEIPYIGGGFPAFLVFALLISLIYTLKFLVLKAAGVIFMADKPVSSYIFNIFLINNMLGIALLPLVLSIAFLPSGYSLLIVKAAILLVSAAFLYRIARGFSIGLSVPGFSAFHLFLYLCTLEFAPLLILYKVLS